MIGFLNSLVPTLEYVDRKFGGGKERELFTSVLTCLKITGGTTMILSLSLAEMVGMMLFQDLPASWTGLGIKVFLTSECGCAYRAAIFVSMTIEYVVSCLLWLGFAMNFMTLCLGLEVYTVMLENVG